MRWQDFKSLVEQAERPVILIEGTRDLPALDRRSLTETARTLALVFPQAVFRTGNAIGSDEAFARGVEEVDPGRLQYVLPYRSHGKTRRSPASYAISVDQISPLMETRLAEETQAATPDCADMLRKQDRLPALKAKSRYLLRDTLKVIGGEADLPRATVALFYVRVSDPMKGGTGHTLRVCLQNGIPVITQAHWMTWMDEMSDPDLRRKGYPRRIRKPRRRGPPAAKTGS